MYSSLVIGPILIPEKALRLLDGTQTKPDNRCRGGGGKALPEVDKD
jgi:hypothetical protein